MLRGRSDGGWAVPRLLLPWGSHHGTSEARSPAQWISRQRLLRRAGLAAALGLPEGRIGWQGPGRTAGCTWGLVEGQEHSLSRLGLSMERPADAEVLALQRAPVLGGIGMWWLACQQAFSEGGVSLAKVRAAGCPGGVHTP